MLLIIYQNVRMFHTYYAVFVIYSSDLRLLPLNSAEYSAFGQEKCSAKIVNLFFIGRQNIWMRLWKTNGKKKEKSYFMQIDNSLYAPCI